MRRSMLGRVLIGAALTVSMASGALAATMPSAAASGGASHPPFDFTDRFYRQNGVNPAMVAGRPTADGTFSVIDESPDANHRDVRVRFTLPGYDLSGHTLYWTVLGELTPGAFTANAAGKAARRIAEASPVYVFPVRGTDPLSVTNTRQANMIDTTNGYFSNNPLALWVHVFVNWTPAAFDTAAGRRALADLVARNGAALDGTPIIKTKSDLDQLAKAGLVTLQRRPVTTQGRWFVCPVLEDPRNGAIAPDAFLVTVRTADGDPLPAEQDFVTNFESLRTTGDWATDH
jgi:hypothetical protein